MPHLVLQAFLRRVLNTGGTVRRELAEGRGRLDLCMHYGEFRYPIELKLRYSDETCEEGKKQLARYMDNMGCREGWLVVFDKRKKTPWDAKIFWQTHQVKDKTIHIVGC